MKRIAPDADMIDITHGIPRQDVARGALVLASALPYMPLGVHVAVVDPGVGTGRAALALRGMDGRLHVGPDNGLLLLATDALGGVDRAVAIENAEWTLTPVSATFHGRDVFAPAAAHLARGVSLDELGPPVAAEDLVRLATREPRTADGALHVVAVDVDRFGNVTLDGRLSELVEAGVTGDSVAVDVRGRRHHAARGRTFADVGVGELVLLEDSARRMALAVNGGDAARVTGIAPGDEVVLLRA